MLPSSRRAVAMLIEFSSPRRIVLEAACGAALVPRRPVVTPLSISSRPGCLAIESPNQIQVARNKT
jgi:hypothetical protein